MTGKVMLRLKMEVSLLCTIMFSAIALSQEEVLTVNSSLRAQCDQPLSLTCHISSKEVANIIKMTWNNGVQLCNHTEKNITKHMDSLGNFNCVYEEGERTLTLTFTNVKTMNKGVYRCNLHSDYGVYTETTTVTLQECYTGVSVSYTQEEGPVCNFTGVHPEGEVHWFRGSSKLPGHETTTTIRVEEEGKGLTIHSKLRVYLEAGHEDYNCSLWNPKSQRYITSRLLLNPAYPGKEVRSEVEQSHQVGGGAQAIGTFWKLWGFPLLLTHLLMKL